MGSVYIGFCMIFFLAVVVVVYSSTLPPLRGPKSKLESGYVGLEKYFARTLAANLI